MLLILSLALATNAMWGSANAIRQRQRQRQDASLAEVGVPEAANEVSETSAISGKIRFSNAIRKTRDGNEVASEDSDDSQLQWTDFTFELSNTGAEEIITIGEEGQPQTIITRQETEYAGYMRTPRESSRGWEGDSSRDHCRLTIVTDKIQITGVEHLAATPISRQSLRIEWDAQKKTNENCEPQNPFADHRSGETDEYLTFTAHGQIASFERGAANGTINTLAHQLIVRGSGKRQYYRWEHETRNTTDVEREFAFDLELNTTANTLEQGRGSESD